jgi:urease accessory protein
MRADRVIPAGAWDLDNAIDEITLDFNDRYRRRIVLKTDADRNILLNLPRTAHLRENDGLHTSEGIVRVRAKAEQLLSLTADPHTILRIAWHLGNRHLPVQLLPAEIRLHVDHVIADMARTLGATVRTIEAAFDPEPGAYESHDHR